jgi:RNA polymerase sigma-70 factor, ECF subfamily
MPGPPRDPEDVNVKRALVMAGVGRVADDALDAATPMSMDEEAFRAFYDLTSRAVWAYLAHVTGDPHAADDLLQETYIRFLGASRRWESDAHRRNFLFRVATNLARDRHRRNAVRRAEPLDEHGTQAGYPGQPAGDREASVDLARALQKLPARERELLWLAYAEGSSHQEIAEATGLRAGGIRVLLFRARRKLAGLLRGTAKGVRP